MSFALSVKGVNEALARLKKEADAKADGFEVGIIEAGYFVLRQSMEIVPVETGLLRASAEATQDGHGFKTTMTVSYSTSYAVFVHERLDLAHGAVYNRKYAEDIALGRKKAKGVRQQAKFIKDPVRQNRDKIIGIVRDRTFGG